MNRWRVDTSIAWILHQGPTEVGANGSRLAQPPLYQLAAAMPAPRWGTWVIARHAAEIIGLHRTHWVSCLAQK